MGDLNSKDTVRTPFIEHVHELRRRLLVCLVFVIIGAGIGYSINEWLLEFIQRPLGEKLFYTSPTGGFSFVFMLCVFFGIVVALPCIIYQIIAFLKPLIPNASRRSMFFYPLCSVFLAGLGITFAYAISLPASLHFLANFGSGNIESLITTDTYFNFALAYIAGFAILFQLPLILIIINRITPLKPGRLMKWERYVIIGSFIAAAIITPTPDPFNQLLMAGPIIILYQFSIFFIWMINKGNTKKATSKSFISVPHPAVPVVQASVPRALVERPLPQQPATPKRRLITDIAASHRTISSTAKKPALHRTHTNLKVPISERPQWSGGLIDVVRQ